MKKFFGLVVGALVGMSVMGGGYPAFLGIPGNSSDAGSFGYFDDGEIVARFQSSNNMKGETAVITFYYDSVLWESDGEDSSFAPNEMTIEYNDIKKLNTWGSNFLIRTNSGQSLEFQLLNGIVAGKLKRKIRELMKES